MVPGVQTVVWDFAKDQVSVDYDALITKPAALEAAIENAGNFQATELDAIGLPR